jgi:hypothetical protein
MLMADGNFYRNSVGGWGDHFRRVDRHTKNAKFDVGPDATQEEIKQADEARKIAGLVGAIEECLTGAQIRARRAGLAVPLLPENIRVFYMRSIALRGDEAPPGVCDEELRSMWRRLHPASVTSLAIIHRSF